MKPTVLSIFAGGGGLDEGFHQAGFDIVAQVEMVAAACDTLRTRNVVHWLRENKPRFADALYTQYLKEEISREHFWSLAPSHVIDGVMNVTISTKRREKLFSRIADRLDGRKLDVIIGGPPCQAFSSMSNVRGTEENRNDPRAFLFYEFIALLKRFQPKAFLFENVANLLTIHSGMYFGRMLDAFEAAGYSLQYKRMNVKKYGVCQNRVRVILVGVRKDLGGKFKFPGLLRNTHRFANITADLPQIEAGNTHVWQRYLAPANQHLRDMRIRDDWKLLTQHNAFSITMLYACRYREILQHYKRTGERLKFEGLSEGLKRSANPKTARQFRYRHLLWDKCPFAILTHKSNHIMQFIHPEELRPISIRESARIQSFPDDYFFEGGLEAALKQIGNAVPVFFAYRLAQQVKSLLRSVK